MHECNFFSDKTIFRLWVRCYTYFWHQKLFDHFLQSLGNTLLCRFLGPNSQIFYGLHSGSLRCSRQTNDFGVAGGLAIIKNPINLIAENATFIIILSESTFLRMRTWFAPAGLDQITHKSFPLFTIVMGRALIVWAWTGLGLGSGFSPSLNAGPQALTGLEIVLTTAVKKAQIFRPLPKFRALGLVTLWPFCKSWVLGLPKNPGWA